ncbi:MAG TPA: glycosyltransferase family 4 protein [Thermoanaerobaculia bacterium]|jgi:glycosyltransferase involved in cell wall biosynthesis|nr:glycosyltransferase family 4 protein [Thermoanaerobaculia bacterium]
MKVLHLAAGNRWTGAAAPAFAETEALREAGVDAHYAYVGGYKLQQKLAHHDFAHPIIAKAQNPFAFARTVNAIARLVDHHRFDVVHAHLTYDHWLANVATRGTRTKVVRTFHARRVLRGDPLTRWLIARSAGLCVINDSFVDAPPIRGRNPLFTPPPLDFRQFSPEGADVRERYGIPADVLLLVAIGKLSKGRGFEDVLRTYALVKHDLTTARLMIIGHGEHRPALEALARELKIDVIWAGYHEDDLAEHYRAADILLFTARGSDEGHRAVLEAMACGIAPVTFPIEGIAALLGDLGARSIADESSPEAAAAKVIAASTDLAHLRRRAYERSQNFGYAQAAARLIEVYQSARG